MGVSDTRETHKLLDIDYKSNRAKQQQKNDTLSLWCCRALEKSNFCGIEVFTLTHPEMIAISVLTNMKV